MKKEMIVIATLAAVIVLLCGCKSVAGDFVSSVGESALPNELAGEEADYTAFSVTVADGWERMDVQGGVQIYKPSGEILQIQIDGENMTDADDLAVMESLKQSNNGSDIEEVQLLGKTFRKMSYTASAVDQCIYTTIEGGKQVKIQTTGKSYDDNAEIKGMVESIVFK